MEQSLLQEDYQQESIKTIKELSWLGGIFDGEGCISLRYHARKDNYPIISPVITVTNTDKVMVDEIIRIYTKYNIPFWLSHIKGKGNWSEAWEINITGLKRCSKVIPILKDYLVNKKSQLDNVSEWINYRLSLLGKSLNYTDYDLSFVTKAREFNKKGNNSHKSLLSSETIRKTEKSDDIVRPTAKSVELDRNDLVQEEILE